MKSGRVGAEDGDGRCSVAGVAEFGGEHGQDGGECEQRDDEPCAVGWAGARHGVGLVYAQKRRLHGRG